MIIIYSLASSLYLYLTSVNYTPRGVMERESDNKKNARQKNEIDRLGGKALDIGRNINITFVFGSVPFFCFLNAIYFLNQLQNKYRAVRWYSRVRSIFSRLQTSCCCCTIFLWRFFILLDYYGLKTWLLLV